MELPLHRGQCPGIPAPSQLQSSTPFTLNCIIRIHRTPPLLTGEREESQPCSNSHAAGAANANRDIGS